MIKLLHLEITDTCNECPYCQYSSYSSGSTDSGYDCRNNDTPVSRIANDSEIRNSNNKKSKGWPLVPVPEWCPLPTWIEGSKF